jgi:hypothetical protein
VIHTSLRALAPVPDCVAAMEHQDDEQYQDDEQSAAAGSDLLAEDDAWSDDDDGWGQDSTANEVQVCVMLQSIQQSLSSITTPISTCAIGAVLLLQGQRAAARFGSTPQSQLPNAMLCARMHK